MNYMIVVLVCPTSRPIGEVELLRASSVLRCTVAFSISISYKYIKYFIISIRWQCFPVAKGSAENNLCFFGSNVIGSVW
jgi:hypothetical protein